MNIGGFEFQVFDLLVLLWLLGWFVLGFIQGTVRRLLGLASILFSFYVAANAQGPLGDFLGDNWTQFPPEYAKMVGFLTVFGAGVVAFSIVIQGTYRKQPLFEKTTFVDEILGGLLGVLQGFLLLVFLTIVLDSFFLLPGFPVDEDEIGFLRDFWNAVNGSATGDLLHNTVIPFVVTISAFLIPDSIRTLYSA